MREPASIPDQLTTIEPDVAAFLDRHALRQPTAGGKVSSLLAAEDVHELLARRSGSHRCRVAPQLTPRLTTKVYRVPSESGEGDRYFCEGDECGHGL
jgi:hypothetical protein